jgi:competence ComEA-like helix-hairpin-helix protein
MVAMTPAERRGALVLVAVLGLGAARDLWVAGRPVPPPGAAAVDSARVERGRRTSRPSAFAESVEVVPDPLQSARAPVDLNRATVSDLDALPGIGPVLARRIVEQRSSVGRFRRVEDLLAVRGIGPRLFERLRPLVTTGPP